MSSHDTRIGHPLTFDELPEDIKQWARMSTTEVNKYKNKKCSNCEYLLKLSASLSDASCGYIDVEKKMRGGTPLNCDKFKPLTKKRKTREIVYKKVGK